MLTRGWWFFLLTLNLLVACGDKKATQQTPTNVDGCTAAEQNEIVYAHMLSYYYWWDHIPADIDVDAYAGPEQLLPALLYQDLDRWSYIMDKSTEEAWYASGGYIGIGIMRQYDTAGNLRITQVYKGSPADVVGLKRGYTIVAINGVSVADIEAANAWDTAWGPAEIGAVVELLVKDHDGVESTVSATKDEVTADPVQKTALYDVGEKKVGYVLVDSFIDTTDAQLRVAFETFKAAGVNELVLDLRYNGGGYVSGADYLASLIAGTLVTDKVFATFAFNSKHADLNGDLPFAGDASVTQDALSLPRVLVLTTADTASASELVINGLRPFVDVIQVGGRTHGKPVGMLSVEFCDKVLAPITFATVNASGNGGYFDGLAPTCSTPDDYSREFGDPSEGLLAGALYYIENGQCMPAAPGIAAQNVTDSRPRHIARRGFSLLQGGI